MERGWTHRPILLLESHRADLMVMAVSLCALLCALLCGATEAFGQEVDSVATHEPVFERFDSGDGLPNNTIHALHATSDGFLWIGTTDGLARWDGYRFEVFADGLTGTQIKAIDSSPDGQLYVLSSSALLLLDTTTGAYTHWPFQDAQSMLMLEKEIWIQASGSVYRIQLRDDDSERTEPERILGTGEDRTRPERIWGMLEGQASDRNGVPPIWLSSIGNGLIRLNPETLETRTWPWPAQSTSMGRFPGLFHWNQDIVVSHAQGAFKVSLSDQAPDSLSFTDADEELFSHPWHAVTGHEDVAESMVIGTDLGVFLGDGRRVLVESGATRELSNVVLAAQIMPDGTIWLGTRNGLYRMQPQHTAGSDLILPGVPILSAAKSDTAIWVGTFGQGVYTLERRKHSSEPGAPPMTGQSRTGTATKMDMGSCSPTVWTIFIDSAQHIWAGTDTGLCQWNRDSWRFQSVLLGDRDPVSVHAITEFPQGKLLIGTTNGRCELELDRLENSASARCEGESFHVQGLAVDSSGDLWMTLFDGRVFRNDLLLDGVTLDGEGGWMIADVGAAIAISSATGLAVMFVDGRARTYLQDHIVYAADQMPDGTVWASTNRGLYRTLSLSKKSVDSVELTDSMGIVFEPVGIFQSEFNRRALLTTDGSLYVGGMDGLTRIDRLSETSPLTMSVTRVNMVGRDTSWVWAGLPDDGLRLSHRHVSFDIELAALGAPGTTESVVYRYRLEGFESDWNTPRARTARYTNLPPGTYELLAEARAPASVARLSIPVHVSRAWWATWWFRMGVLLLLAAAGATAWRLRLAHLEAMARVRSRIASDLHDDVGSQLAGIALLSELVASTSSLPADASNRLDTIGKTARELVSSVRDISWLAHPAHDQVQDLVDRMREAAQALIGNRSWTINAQGAQDRRRLTPHARRHIFLVYKEALHNIGRHAGPDADVTITLRTEGTRILLSVSDTGDGFRPERDGSGQGLRNMSDRAREAGGRLEIQSTPGVGTTITLEVPA